MTITTNVFAPSEQKGDVKNKTKGFRIDGFIASTESGTMVPGTAVKLAHTANAQLDFLVAATGDEIFGIVEYEATKTNSYAYVAGGTNTLTVASLGSIIVLEASAAIVKGAYVAYVATGAKVRTATTGDKIIGISLGKATADGNLIRVLLTCPNSQAVIAGS